MEKKMRKFLKNVIVVFTFAFLFTGLILSHKSEYVEAGNKYPTYITLQNTSPFELKDVQLQFNYTDPVVIASVQSGEKVKVEIPEEAILAVTITVKGDSDLVGSFANCFSGRIVMGTELGVYLDEEMKLGVSSNIPEE